MHNKPLDTPPDSPGSLEQFAAENDVEIIELNDEDMEEFNNEMEYAEDEEDDVDIVPPARASLQFEHTEPIFTASFSPNESMVITGGQDDKAIVWDTKSGEIIFQCTHEESVTVAAFSRDNNYVATGDMNGGVKIWNVATKDLHSENSIDSEVVWLFWHPSSNILFAGCKLGDWYMWAMPQVTCKIAVGFGAENTCSALMADGKRLACGYNTGDIKIWDLKTVKATQTYTSRLEFQVNCIATHEDNNLIAAGYEGAVILIKSNTGTEVGMLRVGHNLIEDLKFGFGPNSDLLAVADASKVTFWDYARHILRITAKFNESEYVSRIAWGNDGFLYAGGTLRNGMVYRINGRTGEFISFVAHRDAILDISLSKDSKCVLTSSEDGTAKIFEIATVFQH